MKVHIHYLKFGGVLYNLQKNLIIGLYRRLNNK